MKLIATLLLAAPLLAAAQTYDLAADFSTTRNAGQPWQYGWSTGYGQSFVPYGSSHKNGTPLDYWWDGVYPEPAPSVSHNPTSQAVTADGYLYAPGAAAFSPGPLGEYSIYRWLAPQSGEYHLDASFFGLGSHATVVYVLGTHGGQLFRGDIQGVGSTQSFSGNFIAPAGTGYDFVVSTLGAGTGWDATGISVQVTMVPEPASALMAGLGLALLCVWLRRHGRG